MDGIKLSKARELHARDSKQVAGAEVLVSHKIKVASEAASRIDSRKVSFAMDDSTENTPLKGGESRPSPGVGDHLNAIGKFFFILLDRKWGVFGFIALISALSIITATAVFVNFFSGCAAMVACFACVFCYGTSHAADGQYKNAAPFCLAGLLIIGGGVLCAQFFIKYHNGYNGHEMFGPSNAGYPLSYFAQHPVDVAGNYVHLSEGAAKTDMIGSFEECLHKLPVVGSCINRFYCVVPFVAPTWKATDVVTLWAGSYLATDCSTPQFVHSADFLEWITGVKRGIGYAPSESWKHAIDNAVVKHGLKTLSVADTVVSGPQAQVLHIVANPFAEKDHNWSMGWTVICTCLSLYFFILIAFGFCGGWADAAYPAYREALYGPNDRVVVRHRKRAEPANKV